MNESEDHRSSHRARTLKGGRIVFNAGYGVVDCTIRNLTDHGALLEIGEVFGVPSEFELQINPDKHRRPCHVVWREGRRLGVKFVDPPESRAPPPGS